jgi:hypothetical protein
MSKWDIPRYERMAEIRRELVQLLNEQTEFFRKGPRHTAEELRNYEASRERVRELFAELEKLTKVA